MAGPRESPPAPEGLAGFEAEARAFLASALTDDLRRAARATTGVHSDIAASREWHRRLYAKGWAAPAWPKAFGGTGWSLDQRFLWDRLCAENDAPVLSASGLRALGPLLIDAGNSDLISRYLAPTLAGDMLWCQGFSEPGAGSDLAALALKATREADGYRLDGSKIWTTGAQHSSHMFLLARTERGAKRQEGMIFLLAPMNLPGLTVRPIPMLNGDAEFAEVRFDHVFVPAIDRVGAEGDGWNVAKRLMRFARSNNTTTAILARGLRLASAAADDHGAAAEPALIQARAALGVRLEAFAALEQRMIAEGRLTGDDDQAPSLLKLLASELNQEIAAYGQMAAGTLGAPVFDHHAWTQAGSNGSPRAGAGAHAMSKYLATRAASIYSGTSETHRNVLAARLLGRL